MALEDYVDVGFWFPIFVAGLSIFLAWFFTRLLEKDDTEEDDVLTQKIKKSLNPDKVVSTPTTSDDSNEETEEVAHSNTESLEGEEKEALKFEDELTPDEETERRIQHEQLHHIFELMETDKEKYGVTSFDEVKEDMKRYHAG